MSSAKQEVRLEGRVEMHVAGGYSKIAVRIGGSRMIDVRTEKIPPHLRGLGTKVLVVFKQTDESFHSAREHVEYDVDEVLIQDLPENAEFGWFPPLK